MESTYSLEGDGALVVQHSINARSLNFSRLLLSLSLGRETSHAELRSSVKTNLRWKLSNHTTVLPVRPCSSTARLELFQPYNNGHHAYTS